MLVSAFNRARAGKTTDRTSATTHPARSSRVLQHSPRSPRLQEPVPIAERPQPNEAGELPIHIYVKPDGQLLGMNGPDIVVLLERRSERMNGRVAGVTNGRTGQEYMIDQTEILQDLPQLMRCQATRAPMQSDQYASTQGPSDTNPNRTTAPG